MSLLEVGELDHREQALARVHVELLESEICKHPVLPYHGHEVGGYADDKEVQQRDEALERHAVTRRIALHQLEAYPASGEVVERIAAVLPLRVEHGHGVGNHLVWQVVVAYYHVDTPGRRVFHLVDRLYAAVEGYYQRESVLGGPVDTLERHPVTLVVTVGDIGIHPGSEPAQERIHQRYGSRAVDIIVSVYEYALLTCDSPAETLYSDIHVLHQERVVQIVQARAEERTGLLESGDPPLDEQLGEDPVYAYLRRQPLDLFTVGGVHQIPFAFFPHIQTNIVKSRQESK